jgi:hypothetical protein
LNVNRITPAPASFREEPAPFIFQLSKTSRVKNGDSAAPACRFASLNLQALFPMHPFARICCFVTH